MKNLLLLLGVVLPGMALAQTAKSAEALLFEMGHHAARLQQNEVAKILGPAEHESLQADKRIWRYHNDSLSWQFLFNSEQQLEAFTGELQRTSNQWLPLEKVRAAQKLTTTTEMAALLGKPQSIQYQKGESIWQYLIQGSKKGEIMRIWLRFDAAGQLQPNGFAFEMRQAPSGDKLSERKLRRVEKGSSLAEVQRSLGMPVSLTINGKQEKWDYWASNVRLQLQFDENGTVRQYFLQSSGR